MSTVTAVRELRDGVLRIDPRSGSIIAAIQALTDEDDQRDLGAASLGEPFGRHVANAIRTSTYLLTAVADEDVDPDCPAGSYIGRPIGNVEATAIEFNDGTSVRLAGVTPAELDANVPAARGLIEAAIAARPADTRPGRGLIGEAF